MTQTAQQASIDASKEPTIPNDTADTQIPVPANTSISSQRVFRVYKPLGGRSKKARAAGIGARAKKSGFFADRFDRSVAPQDLLYCMLIPVYP